MRTSKGGQNPKLTFVHLDVHTSLPNIVLARLFIHDTLVLRETAGLRARGGDDGAFVELGYRDVALQLDTVEIEPASEKYLTSQSMTGKKPEAMDAALSGRIIYNGLGLVVMGHGVTLVEKRGGGTQSVYRRLTPHSTVMNCRVRTD